MARLAITGLAVALAQTTLADPGSRAMTWHVGGGSREPSGRMADYVQGGWVLHGGFTYAPKGSPLGLRADLSLSCTRRQTDSWTTVRT